MNQGTTQDTVLALEKAKQSVERSLVMMQREITGFCAGTGKSKEITDIARSINREYDFLSFMQKCELEYANLSRNLVIARETLDSCVNVSPDLIKKIQKDIQGIKSVQESASRFLREIKEHNTTAKKYPINNAGVLKIKKAGLVSNSFNKELKLAKDILKRIDEKFKVDFAGFVALLNNARKRLKENEADLIAKTRLIEEHDLAVDEYRLIKTQVDNYSVQKKFSALLVKAFNDKRFIYAFAMMSGRMGKTVVDAVFKHRLLCLLLDECSSSLEELSGSPYDFSNEHNAKVILSKVNKVLSIFDSVDRASVSFDFSHEKNFEDMYRSFIREVSKVSGVSLAAYRDRDFDYSKMKQPNLEILTLASPRSAFSDYREEVKEEKPKGMFASLLGKAKKKQEPLLVM